MTSLPREPGARAGTVATLLRRAGYELRTLVAQYPAAAVPLARLRGHGYPVGAETEVVIEGFPRSGTSFAVSAFEYPQVRKPVVAHHVHSPSQVIAAARRGLPALVLIRDPEDATLSLVIRTFELTIGQALRGYVRFYRPLLPYRDRMVVATFQQVTTDFGAVVRRMNARFGTAWRPFPHTDENVRGVLRAIDAYTRGTPEGAFERVVARPSAAREEPKRALRDRYRAGRLRRVRERAEELHASFVAAASGR